MNKENPVAWFSTSPDGKLSNKFACKPTEGNWVEPLYTAPPKRTWVGLTDEEYFSLQMKIRTPMISVQDYINAMQMVEKALKEKNT